MRTPWAIAVVLTLVAVSCIAWADEYGESASTLAALDAGIEQKDAAIAAHRDDSCGGIGELLELMFDVDQFARSSLGPICPTWENNCLMTAWRRVMAIDDANLKILKPIIARYSWHELKMCGGKDAQLHTWLLVQHADRDAPFQRAVLGQMREAFLAGEVSGTDYAYLVDRVAMGEKKPQTFGTQGKCDGAAWKPNPLLAPNGLDERRHEVGLEPEASYAVVVAQFCKPQPVTPRP
jgi:hypothetical protein